MMPQKFSSFVILSILPVTFLAAVVFAAMSPVEKQGTSPIMNRSLQYGILGKNNSVPVSGKVIRKYALGRAIPTQSPGTVIGTTWYDCQHLGSMGRMIGWSRHGSPDTMIVHFSWMSMSGPVFLGVSTGMIAGTPRREVSGLKPVCSLPMITPVLLALTPPRMAGLSSVATTEKGLMVLRIVIFTGIPARACRTSVLKRKFRGKWLNMAATPISE